MSIVIQEGFYYAVAYFVPGVNQDFMGMVYRDAESFLFSYRFRYYNSADPFDREDKKNWYAVRPRPNAPKDIESYLVTGADVIYKGLLEKGFNPKNYEHYRTEIRGGMKEVEEKWLCLPFMHVESKGNA